jgi:hypothetical protein
LSERGAVAGKRKYPASVDEAVERPRDVGRLLVELEAAGGGGRGWKRLRRKGYSVVVVTVG